MVPPGQHTEIILQRPAQDRLVAFSRFVRDVTDVATLQAAVSALQLTVNSVDPALLQANIIRAVSSRVRTGDPALAGANMDQVSQLLEPILHRTFWGSEA